MFYEVSTSDLCACHSPLLLLSVVPRRSRRDIFVSVHTHTHRNSHLTQTLPPRLLTLPTCLEPQLAKMSALVPARYVVVDSIPHPSFRGRLFEKTLAERVGSEELVPVRNPSGPPDYSCPATRGGGYKEKVVQTPPREFSRKGCLKAHYDQTLGVKLLMVKKKRSSPVKFKSGLL